MTNIVGRLRKPTVKGFYHRTLDPLRAEAADEINRLREQLDARGMVIRERDFEIESLQAKNEELKEWCRKLIESGDFSGRERRLFRERLNPNQNTN